VSSTPEQPQDRPADDIVSTEDLARRQGVKPITSVDELAQPDLWESDEEYEAFLADLYASRRTGLAHLHRWGARRRAGLHAFFAGVVVLPCSFRAASVWGEIQAHARLRGRPRTIDVAWIAACCLARDLPLATFNLEDCADFADHEGLDLVH
jgi:predicted nucleic acid-binding protein